MNDSTEIGGVGAAFPSTSWSLVREATQPTSPERQARLQSLLSGYWKPVYHFIRRRWRKSNEDAKDLTQGFFVLLLEGRYLERLVREHRSLRGYLKAALEHFLIDEERHREALKRGGAASRLPIDFSGLADTLPDPQADLPEDAFDREWIATCLSEAIRQLEQELRQEGRETHVRIFRRFYVDAAGDDAPRYEEIAAELGLATHDVANSLVYTRRRLRNILKERIADTTASEQDAAEELRFILAEE